MENKKRKQKASSKKRSSNDRINKPHKKKQSDSAAKARPSKKQNASQQRISEKRKATKKNRKRPPKKKKRRISRIFGIVFSILFFLMVIGVVAASLLMTRGKVAGAEMEPTLSQGDTVVFFDTEKIQRFSLIAFQHPQDSSKILIERVIGLPGENVNYRDGILSVNEETINEPYYEGAATDSFMDSANNFELKDIAENTVDFPGDPTTIDKIPEDMYLVLGDNRQSVEDSRSFGFIHKKSIQSKALFTYSSENGFHWFGF